MTATEKPTTEAVSSPAVLSGGVPGDSSGSGIVADPPTAAQAFPVSIPQIGAYRTEDHRYYWNGKGPVPSVTTILGVLDKPAVVQWAKRTVAEIAVAKAEEVLGRALKDGPETVKWLAGMPDYQADTAAKLGSSVHLLADMASRASQTDGETFQLSEQEKPYLEAFRHFLGDLERRGGQIISSEKMVWSEQGYAGTYDLLVRIPKPGALERLVDMSISIEELDPSDLELWLLDIKTSKGYYPEYALQLIAYGYADWIIVEGNPMGYPMPLPDRYGVLHLRPDQYPDTGWRLVEYPLVEADYMAFLGALEIWRWKQEKRYTKAILNPDKRARKG